MLETDSGSSEKKIQCLGLWMEAQNQSGQDMKSDMQSQTRLRFSPTSTECTVDEHNVLGISSQNMKDKIKGKLSLILYIYIYIVYRSKTPKPFCLSGMPKIRNFVRSCCVSLSNSPKISLISPISL